MSAYIVVTGACTRNQAEIDLYLKQSARLLGWSPDHVARSLRSTRSVEGPQVEAAAILKFPALAEAKAWYESPAYQEADQYRVQGGDYSAVIVEGRP